MAWFGNRNDCHMGILLFVPAGTRCYWQAWVYLLVVTGASVLITLDLNQRDPALLERRLKGGPRAEKTPTQRVIMVFLSLGFVALLVVPAIDHDQKAVSEMRNLQLPPWWHGKETFG